DDAAYDIVLNSEDFLQVAIVALGPHVVASDGIDELRGDETPLADPTHASFDNVRDAESAAAALHVQRGVSVLEGGMPRNDEQLPKARQFRGDVFGDAVAEILPLRIAAQVREWKNRNRSLTRRREWAARRHGAIACTPLLLAIRDAVDANRPGNVLQRLIAPIQEGEGGRPLARLPSRAS